MHPGIVKYIFQMCDRWTGVTGSVSMWRPHCIHVFNCIKKDTNVGLQYLYNNVCYEPDVGEVYVYCTSTLIGPPSVLSSTSGKAIPETPAGYFKQYKTDRVVRWRPGKTLNSNKNPYKR